MTSIMNGFIFTAFLSLLLKVATATVSLPAVTGAYDVGTIALELTDYSRTNPFANTSHPGPRSIMVSLFYPAVKVNKYPLAPYMPPQTAAYFEKMFSLPDGTLSTFIQPNSRSGAPMRSCNKAQVILFSPGFGVPRFEYTALAEDLASHGYIVVTMDHPGDASIVEFPDGSTIYANPVAANSTTLADIYPFVDIRVKDAQFTLNMLEKNLTNSIPGVPKRLRIKAIGMFGHSLGGATTAETMTVDDRILGGLNMDGSLFGNAQYKGLDKPFLLMGTPSHNLTNEPTWATFWGNHRGWKRAVVLADSAHLTYSDQSVIVELLGLRNTLPADEMDLVIGTINGLRANEIQRAYIGDFFCFVLRGGEGKLFDGPDGRYPEISFQS